MDIKLLSDPNIDKPNAKEERDLSNPEQELPLGEERRKGIFFSVTLPEGFGIGASLDLPLLPIKVGYLCIDWKFRILDIKLAIAII